MKVKNTVLTTLAIFAICNTGYAIAYDPREQHDMKPSVEVNLNVLDTLRNSVPMPTPSPSAPEHDFISEKPVKYATPKSAATKHTHHHKKHKTAHKHTARAQAAHAQKIDTAPEVRVTPSDQEPSPVMVTIPKDNTSGKPAAELPPLPSEPSKSPGLPPLPSESHGSVTPPPSSPTLPPLPEKKPEFIMGPSGQIIPSNPPAEAVPPPPSAAAPSSPPSVPALPPLPSAGETSGAIPPAGGLPEIPALPGAAPSPSIPPLPSASSSSAPSTLPVPPAPAAAAATSGAPAAADNGPPPDLRIVFNEAETDLPIGMSSQLDKIAAQLTSNPSLRVSITAYASGSDAVSIYPKRVSLARGIAVRNYLVTNKGIDVERITVKALGNKNEGGPANRVDLFIIK